MGGLGPCLGQGSLGPGNHCFQLAWIDAKKDLTVGDVVPGEPVRYRWEALELPELSLCHPRNLVIMRAQGGKDELTDRLQSECSFTE